MGMARHAPVLTIKDLDRMPDDGKRYELLDGMLIVTPAPSLSHQMIATVLAARLIAAVDQTVARVVGPGAIQRGERTQLQPDVLVFPARFSRAKDWAGIGEHWLAVEVLSRSSRKYDRGIKREAYFALGVKEVWLVDTTARTVEVCRAPDASEVTATELRWQVPGEDRTVQIDLPELFAAAE